MVDRMRQNYFKLLDEQVYAHCGLDSIKKRQGPLDVNGKPINVRENEMAIKEYQRKTTFELGLRSDKENDQVLSNLNKRTVEPIVNRRNTTDVSVYESASSFGVNQTLGAQLFNDSQRVRN